MNRWIPKGLKDRPWYVFETGGTTGIPKSRVVCDDFKIDYEMFSDTLPEKYRKRDIAPRSRKPLNEFVFGGEWGAASSITK